MRRLRAEGDDERGEDQAPDAPDAPDLPEATDATTGAGYGGPSRSAARIRGSWRSAWPSGVAGCRSSIHS